MRDAYVDVAKGICMLLIVCIHTEVFSVIGMPLTFIAVPMFFFMSGFYDRTKGNMLEWLRKNIRNLILPAVIWSVVGALYAALLSTIKTGVVCQMDFDMFNPAGGNGPAWFLCSLFWVKFLTRLLTRMKIHVVFLLGLSLSLGYAGYHMEFPFYIDGAFVAFPLYMFGKIAYGHIKKILSMKLLIFFSLCALCLFVLGKVCFYIVGTGGSFKPYYLISLLGILMSFPVVLYVSDKMLKVKVLNIFLQSIGRKSLGIMLVHAPMCHTCAVILNRMFEKGSMLWISSFLLAYVMIVFASYYLTAIICKKMPLLLGKR